MYDHILNLQITKSDIKQQVKWAVNLVIIDGHFNLHQGFVWVCTHFISPKGIAKEATSDLSIE